VQCFGWHARAEAPRRERCLLSAPSPGGTSMGKLHLMPTCRSDRHYIRRQRNHAKKTNGKPDAGESRVRIERGMRKRVRRADTRP
jgi:hypothetical protein